MKRTAIAESLYALREVLMLPVSGALNGGQRSRAYPLHPYMHTADSVPRTPSPGYQAKLPLRYALRNGRETLTSSDTSWRPDDGIGTI